MLPADLAARRQEIETVLVDDARRRPAFAMARRSAVLGKAECEGGAHFTAEVAKDFLSYLHQYEEVRGGRSGPSEEALEHARMFLTKGELSAYERARGLPAIGERRHAHRSDGAQRVTVGTMPRTAGSPVMGASDPLEALTRKKTAKGIACSVPAPQPGRFVLPLVLPPLPPFSAIPRLPLPPILADAPATVQPAARSAPLLLVEAMKRARDGFDRADRSIDVQLAELEKTLCLEAVEGLAPQQHSDLVVLLETLWAKLTNDVDADRLFDLASRVRTTTIPEDLRTRLVLLRSRLRERPSTGLSAPRAVDLGLAIVQLQEFFGGDKPEEEALLILEGALVPGAFTKTIGPYQREELVRVFVALSRRLTSSAQRDRLAAVARWCDHDLVSVGGSRLLRAVQDWRGSASAGASS